MTFLRSLLAYSPVVTAPIAIVTFVGGIRAVRSIRNLQAYGGDWRMRIYWNKHGKEYLLDTAMQNATDVFSTGHVLLAIGEGAQNLRRNAGQGSFQLKIDGRLASHIAVDVHCLDIAHRKRQWFIIDQFRLDSFEFDTKFRLREPWFRYGNKGIATVIYQLFFDYGAFSASCHAEDISHYDQSKFCSTPTLLRGVMMKDKKVFADVRADRDC